MLQGGERGLEVSAGRGREARGGTGAQQTGDKTRPPGHFLMISAAIITP
jgi:hypothetical protein